MRHPLHAPYRTALRQRKLNFARPTEYCFKTTQYLRSRRTEKSFLYRRFFMLRSRCGLFMRPFRPDRQSGTAKDPLHTCDTMCLRARSRCMKYRPGLGGVTKNNPRGPCSIWKTISVLGSWVKRNTSPVTEIAHFLPLSAVARYYTLVSYRLVFFFG